MTISKLISGIFKPAKSAGFTEVASEVGKFSVRIPEEKKDSSESKEASKELIQESQDLCPEVCHRLKLIHALKCRYVRLIMAIMILSLVASITLAITMKFLRFSDRLKHEECWRWFKMSHIMYATFLSGLLLFGLRSARDAVLGASLQKLHGFDSFGDQVILCLMMVDLFWVIVGLCSFLSDPKDWPVLVFLVTGVLREILFGLTSITSDRLVILCTTKVSRRDEVRRYSEMDNMFN